MYPKCRHIRPCGRACEAPSLKDSYWCYFHARFYERQTIRHSRRRADGRFVALPAPADSTTIDSTAIETIDYGPYPVGAPAQRHPARSEAPALDTPIDLPPLEDQLSIQLALMEVTQALAANEIDPKRAGLLLYALQVASANVKDMKLPDFDMVRAVTHTEDDTPLAPERFRNYI